MHRTVKSHYGRLPIFCNMFRSLRTPPGAPSTDQWPLGFIWRCSRETSTPEREKHPQIQHKTSTRDQLAIDQSDVSVSSSDIPSLAHYQYACVCVRLREKEATKCDNIPPPPLSVQRGPYLHVCVCIIRRKKSSKTCSEWSMTITDSCLKQSKNGQPMTSN